jgi:hypothetical protein
MLFVAGELLPDDGGGGTDGSGAHLLALLETHLELAALNENFLRCLPANGNAREKRDGRQHKCVVVKQGEVRNEQMPSNCTTKTNTSAAAFKDGA